MIARTTVQVREKQGFCAGLDFATARSLSSPSCPSCGCGIVIKGADTDRWVTIREIVVTRKKECGALAAEIIAVSTLTDVVDLIVRGNLTVNIYRCICGCVPKLRGALSDRSVLVVMCTSGCDRVAWTLCSFSSFSQLYSLVEKSIGNQNTHCGSVASDNVE